MSRVIIRVYHRLDEQRELVEEVRLETESHKRLTGTRALRVLRRAFPGLRPLTGMTRTEEGWWYSRVIEPKPNCSFHYKWADYVVSEDTSTAPTKPWLERVSYLHLPAEARPPSLAMPAPFVAVFVLEQRATAEWQAEISRWIVDSGCRYAVAWGVDCSSWDTSIDVANLEKFNFGDIPDESFVMTTWHEDQELAEALWFAKYNAFHPVVDLEKLLLVHVAVEAREQELLGELTRA